MFASFWLNSLVPTVSVLSPKKTCLTWPTTLGGGDLSKMTIES